MLETNRIYNMDCIKGMELIEDESIDLIVTDPPYKITPRGRHGGTGGMLKTKKSMQGTIFNHNNLDIKDYIDELYRVLKNEGHMYIMINNKNLLHFLNIINKSNFKIFKVLIWYKNTSIINRFYMDSHEYIIFCRKGRAKKINNCGTKSVLEVPIVQNRIHPTQKPVELMKILIENSSQENEIVLDPFMGVGTTALACKQLNRKFIGFEVDKGYCDIANKRLEGEL